LTFFALLAAAVMAYGVDSRLAAYGWGVNAIMTCRRLQWPLVAVSLVLCVALLVLVISGKRRAWWLIGLAPVLMLFAHRFLLSPINRYRIGDEPAFVSPTEATLSRDDEPVLGLIFNEQAYVYPLANLARCPVVMQTDREHRMLLVWSPRLRAGTVLLVRRDLKARDLDIVAEPARALLLYDSRRGQFISAAAGLTPSGETPATVFGVVKTVQTTWGEWRDANPRTRIMVAP
jgi:hypothetical protein